MRSTSWLLSVGFLFALATGAGARIVVPQQDPGPALAAVAAAFRAGDHQALAGLVSADGVSLGLGPVPDRASELTAGQAFYAFKTLFQDRRTLDFTFEKHQEEQSGRVHAMANWSFVARQDAPEDRQRLLVTLVLESDGWKLRDITAWR